MLNKIFLNLRSSGIERSIRFFLKKSQNFILMDSHLSGIERFIIFLGLKIEKIKKILF